MKQSPQLVLQGSSRKGFGGARRHCTRILLLLCGLLLCLPVVPQTLVAHPGVSVKHIDRNMARSFFSMRLIEWSDGTPVRVFVFDDKHPLHVEFCQRELGVFPQQLRRAWDRMVFAGLGQSPTQVITIEEMRERIANTPGAIGYLPKDEIDETVRQLPKK